jgi:hypothetical protein
MTYCLLSRRRVYLCQHLRGTRQPFASGFGSVVVIEHKCSPHNTSSTAEGKVQICDQPSSQFLPIRLPACDIKRAMAGWQISQPAERRMGQTTQRVCLLRIKCNLGKENDSILKLSLPCDVYLNVWQCILNHQVHSATVWESQFPNLWFILAVNHLHTPD